MWLLTALLLVSCCAGDSGLSWDEYAQLIASPPTYTLADEGQNTFGALSACSGDTVFAEGYNVTWLFGAESMGLFVGKGASYALRSVGLSEALIAALARADDTCLFFFKAEGVRVVPSTWEGLAEVLSTFSPVAAQKVMSFVPVLQNATFEELMGSHATMDSNYRDPVLDEEALSWTLAKFEASESVSAFAVRSFLYNVMQASNLFLGNGLSFNSNYGEAQNKEFVTVRLRKADLSEKRQVKLRF